MNNGFIHDGIVDMARWDKSKIKLMFLLKEAYSTKNKKAEWDLRPYIRNEWQTARGNLYKNAMYWSYAVQHLSDKHAPCFPEEDRIDEAIENMLSSAFVNVKKSSGKKTSDKEIINLYAQQDGIYLKQQIELIQPQIIVCGNTWDSIHHIWSSAKEVYDFVWYDSSIVFIDFWHPANRFPKQLNYQALTNVLRSSQTLSIVKNGLTTRSS